MKSISNFFANLRRKKQQKQYAEAHRDTIRSTYLLDKTTPFAVREAFRNLKAYSTANGISPSDRTR